MRASADGCVTIAVVARVTDLGRTGHTDGGRTTRAPVCGAEQAPPIESIRELYLEVTNRCNSLCQTCPLTFGPHEAERDLSLDEMRHVVEQCPGLERVVLHGIGEPLLNRELPGMIGWLADRGLLTVFNTNAIALSERRGDRIVEAGLDSLRISIDGATRATYELLRGVDGLDKVLANARAFRRRHPEAPDCEVFFTCSRANLHELPALVRLVAQIGIHTLNVQRLVYWEQGMAREELALYRDLSQQETALLGAARTAAEREGVRLTASGGGRSRILALRSDQAARRGLRSPLEPRLRDLPRQPAAVLHQPLHRRAVRAARPRQRARATARRAVGERAISAAPRRPRGRRPRARRVSRVRRAVAVLIGRAPGRTYEAWCIRHPRAPRRRSPRGRRTPARVGRLSRSAPGGDRDRNASADRGPAAAGSRASVPARDT